MRRQTFGFMRPFYKFKENLNLWQEITFIFVFFLTTPLIIIISTFALISLQNSQENKVIRLKAIQNQNYNNVPVVLSASVNTVPQIESKITTDDARVELVRKYLNFYKSPLEPYAQLIVLESDKNHIDWRLLIAIAQQESNLCKVIPEGSYNCWGWGIHSRGTLMFDSYEQAIKVIARGIRKNYIEKGYINVEDIMKKYTPRSNGSWAFGVSKFMEDITVPWY